MVRPGTRDVPTELGPRISIKFGTLDRGLVQAPWIFLQVWLESGPTTSVKLSEWNTRQGASPATGMFPPSGLYSTVASTSISCHRFSIIIFLPHLDGALLNISGLAESINSGLIVDGDEGASGVDVVVGAGHIIALPFKKTLNCISTAVLGAASFGLSQYLLSWWLM